MTIVVGLPCLLKGGTEFQTLHLVKVLKKFDLKVSVLVYFEVEADMLATFEHAGADMICLNWKRDIKPLGFVRKLVRVLKTLEPEIFHVQYMAPGLLPIIAAKLAGVKRIIATVHQPYTKSHGLKAKWMLRIAAFFCKPFLSVSQNAERSWFGSSHLIQANLPIQNQPNHLTLYNTVDVEQLQNILKQNADKKYLRSVKDTENTLIIGTVSRLRLEKGIDLLIRAFVKICKSASIPLKLLLVGDGPDRQNLEELVDELGCRNEVIFHGSADWNEAMKLMAQMDLVIVPSRFEGFGLTAAEAMGMGKALIASNTFGLKELISHRKEGLLFDNGSVEDLKSQMDFMINHVDQRSIFGQNGYTKARNKFDLPIFVRNVKTLYHLL